MKIYEKEMERKAKEKAFKDMEIESITEGTINMTIVELMRNDEMDYLSIWGDK